MMLCGTLDKADLPIFLSAIDKSSFVAEEKLDGHRLRLKYLNGKVELLNREGKNINEKFPQLLNLSLPCSQAFFDGEILDDSFGFNITYGVKGKYIIFDLLELDNVDIRDKDWFFRRRTLESLKINHPDMQISVFREDIIGLWQEVVGRGGEGIIIKDINKPYLENTRTDFWRKVKDVRETDLRITKYEKHPKGIVVSTEDGIRVNINGYNSDKVKELINCNGEARIAIRHLGRVTDTGKYRQPTFHHLCE